jgi:hypothetical protein
MRQPRMLEEDEIMAFLVGMSGDKDTGTTRRTSFFRVSSKGTFAASA